MQLSFAKSSSKENIMDQLQHSFSQLSVNQIKQILDSKMSAEGDELQSFLNKQVKNPAYTELKIALTSENKRKIEEDEQKAKDEMRAR